MHLECQLQFDSFGRKNPTEVGTPGARGALRGWPAIVRDSTSLSPIVPGPLPAGAPGSDQDFVVERGPGIVRRSIEQNGRRWGTVPRGERGQAEYRRPGTKTGQTDRAKFDTRGARSRIRFPTHRSFRP